MHGSNMVGWYKSRLFVLLIHSRVQLVCAGPVTNTVTV